MYLFISCPYGLGSSLAHELKKLGFGPENTFQTGTFVHTDISGMMKINVRSRIANKVFIQLGEGSVNNFDQLFSLIQQGEYDQYLSNTNISFKVHSENSQLSSLKTIQSVAHKALLEKIKNFGKEEVGTTELLIIINNNMMKWYLNSSGPALHQRAWRTKTGLAPLKENIAAVLPLLAGWKFKAPLIDPFCGSGTIAIEAALLAKNIAPGIQRRFAFENFKNFEKKTFEDLKADAKNQVFSDTYTIFAYDNDPQMLDIAKYNAEKAGVTDCIHFQQQDFLDFKPIWTEPTWMITNPPYGKRIKNQNLDLMYTKLRDIFIDQLFGGWISSYPCSEMPPTYRKSKKLFNGNEACTFHWRK